MKIRRQVSTILLLFIVFIVNIVNAEQIIDKKGKIIYDIIKPTAESTINPDTISDALRIIPDTSIDYNGDLSKKYAGPQKNIFSKDILYQDIDKISDDVKEYTLIRHTSSITDLTEEKYFLTQDYKKDRLKITIITEEGHIYGKDGFFKIDDKIYYFDNEGLMVLGPCYDNIGNYYFFSYDTGELLEEIQKK